MKEKLSKFKIKVLTTFKLINNFLTRTSFTGFLINLKTIFNPNVLYTYRRNLKGEL